jgi:hypothetical protein
VIRRWLNQLDPVCIRSRRKEMVHACGNIGTKAASSSPDQAALPLPLSASSSEARACAALVTPTADRDVSESPITDVTRQRTPTSWRELGAALPVWESLHRADGRRSQLLEPQPKRVGVLLA